MQEHAAQTDTDVEEQVVQEHAAQTDTNVEEQVVQWHANNVDLLEQLSGQLTWSKQQV